MYFLVTTNAVCPNINPIMLCVHVCDVNYVACYYYFQPRKPPLSQTFFAGWPFKQIFNHDICNFFQLFTSIKPRGGGLPYIKGGDARREISNEPLKGTNLGVA